VNAEWKSKVGEGTAVNWPVGAGGKGNEGVAAFVGRLPNSIGYVEYAYVKQNKMTFAQLKNAAGNFVSPEDKRLQGRRRRRRVVQELLPDPDRAAWQGFVAHHRRHVHPDAKSPGQASPGRRVAQVL
jgi:phosphate transport system substrate-binding protein